MLLAPADAVHPSPSTMHQFISSASSITNFTIPTPRPIHLHQLFSPPHLPIYLLLTFLIILLTLFFRRTPLSTLAIRALRLGPIPSHVAFIMDGNRRWARRLSLPDFEGHPQGGEKLIQSLQWCLEAGIRTVTVYAFSIENFKRSQVEVDHIMALAERKFFTLAHRAAILHTHRVRVRVLGDLTRVPHSLRGIMSRVVADTASYVDGPVLNVCFAYTARHDIATAVADLVNQVRETRLHASDITEHTIQACLSTGTVKGAQEPCTQLLVRTSGETRLSDFLLWESARAVLSFYPVLWPDLSAWDFVNILMEYQSYVRQRLPDTVCHSFQRRVSDSLTDIGRKHFERIHEYCKGVSSPS